MRRQNCWEHFGCGREPGGTASGAEGTCPSSTESRLDGANSGRNAGRACWVAAGVLSTETQCSTHASETSCLSCEFYERVFKEERESFICAPELLKKLDRATMGWAKLPD